MNKEKLKLINLYDRYSMFLTDKQRRYFENYYFEDLSLQEIADNYNISKNAVFKQIKNVEEKLYDIENKMFDKKKVKSINEVLSKIKEEDLREKIRGLFFN